MEINLQSKVSRPMLALLSIMLIVGCRSRSVEENVEQVQHRIRAGKTISKSELKSYQLSYDSRLFADESKQVEDLNLFEFSLLNRNYEMAQLILDQHFPIDTSNEDGSTALMLLAEFDDAKGIEWLLKRGAYVDQRDKRGFSALMYACEYVNSQAVKALLAAKADPNLKTHNNLAPMIAVMGNDLQWSEETLASLGNKVIPSNLKRPLSSEGRDVVHQLLENGALPIDDTIVGFQGLHLAIVIRDNELVLDMLSSSRLEELKSAKPPLIWTAETMGNEEAAKFLKERLKQ